MLLLFLLSNILYLWIPFLYKAFFNDFIICLQVYTNVSLRILNILPWLTPKPDSSYKLCRPKVTGTYFWGGGVKWICITEVPEHRTATVDDDNTLILQSWSGLCVHFFCIPKTLKWVVFLHHFFWQFHNGKVSDKSNKNWLYLLYFFYNVSCRGILNTPPQKKTKCTRWMSPHCSCSKWP